jgi:hypothetical protein
MSTLRSLPVALALLAAGTLTCLPGRASAQQPVIVAPPPAQPVYPVQPQPVYAPPAQPVYPVQPQPVYAPPAQPGYYTPPPGQPVPAPAYAPQPQPVPGYYPQPAPGAPADPAAQQMYNQGRSLRRAGKPLTIIGAVLMPLGLIVAVSGVIAGTTTAAIDCTGSSSPSCLNRGISGGAIAYYSGLGMTVVGVAMLGAGIPLWVIGQRKMNNARSMGAVGLALDTSRLHLAPLYLPSSNTLAGGTAGLSFQF